MADPSPAAARTATAPGTFTVAARAADTPVRIEGGRTPRTAAAVAAGRYRDTILPADERWYRLDLLAGQVPQVVVAPTGGAVGPLSPFAELRLELRSDDTIGDLRCQVAAAREIADGDGDLLPDIRVRVVGDPVATGAGLCREPGRYYVRLRLIDAVEHALTGARVDYRVTVRLAETDELDAVEPSAPAAPGDALAGFGRSDTRTEEVDMPRAWPLSTAIMALACGALGVVAGSGAARGLDRNAR